MAAMLLVLYLLMAVYQSYKVFAAHKMSTYIVGPTMGELYKCTETYNVLEVSDPNF